MTNIIMEKETQKKPLYGSSRLMTIPGITLLLLTVYHSLEDEKDLYN